MDSEQRVLKEAMAARERAEAVVRTLMAEQAASEKLLAETKRTDLYKGVTGRSGIENAIETARRAVRTLDAAIADARRRIGQTVNHGSVGRVPVVVASRTGAAPAARRA